jgi:TolB-like protein
LVVGTAVAGWTSIRIAVLPLVNISQNPADEYLADGLTSELISKLSILEGLSVRSQTSSFAFKGKPRNIVEAGVQLDVNYILEGSVLGGTDRLRILVQLVRVHDDVPVWSGRYEARIADLLEIQDEVSRGIVNNLRLKLGRGRRRYETSPEAYDFYLRARALETRVAFLGGYQQSLSLFEQAIAKDSSFAPAYAGLAAAHAWRSGMFRANIPDEAVKMRVAVDKAVQLDPLLAETYDALGMIYARDGQFGTSRKRASAAQSSSIVTARSRTRTSPYTSFGRLAVWRRPSDTCELLRNPIRYRLKCGFG